MEGFLEKYRVWIGGGLLFLVIASGGYLFWQKKASKPAEGISVSRIDELERQIDDMNNKIATLTDKLAKADLEKSSKESETASSGEVAGATSASAKTTVSSSEYSGMVNLNTASVAQLDSLPGIGEAYAGRIIEYRNAHGGFKSIEEVMEVKGIGEKTFEKMRSRITI